MGKLSRYDCLLSAFHVSWEVENGSSSDQIVQHNPDVSRGVRTQAETSIYVIEVDWLS